MQKMIAMALLLIGMSGAAVASGVPEIDPTSGVSALALLSGALLLMRTRKN